MVPGLARDNVTSSSSHAVEVFAKARSELQVAVLTNSSVGTLSASAAIYIISRIIQAAH